MSLQTTNGLPLVTQAKRGGERVYDGSYNWEANPDDLKDLLKPDAIIYSAAGWFLINIVPLTNLNNLSSEEVTKKVNKKELKKDERKAKFDALMNDSDLHKCVIE